MDYKILILRTSGDIEVYEYSSPVTARHDYDIHKLAMFLGDVIRLTAFGKVIAEYDSERG